MYIIVPLAGPDFIDNNGNIKGEKIYNNNEILYEILNSRPWHDAVPSSNYIFIIYNDSRVVNFADQKIKNVWTKLLSSMNTPKALHLQF